MRRIGRRIGLRHARAIGLYGMISALALAAAAPLAVAQAPEPAVERAPAAAAAPAETEAAPQAALPEARTPVSAAAAPPQAAAAPSQGVRAGGASVRPGQTRYSKRQKGIGGGATPTEATKPTETADVVCRAGCDAVPGGAVFTQPTVKTASAADASGDDDDEKPIVQGQASIVTCVAGCFDTATSFSGVPNGTEGSYALTKSKMPAGKPTSGEWLVRINRERGAEPGK